MAGRIAVLRAEGGAEGIDLGKAQGKNLGLQLTANCQVCGPAKKVLRPVDVTVRAAREVAQVQGCYIKHLACPFAIRGGDNRRLNVDEVSLLKEAVNCVGEGVAHAEGRAEGVATDPQVGDVTQELEGMSLLLQRVGRGICRAVDGDPCGFQLHRLARRGRFNQDSGRGNGTAGCNILERLIRHHPTFHHQLQAPEPGAIV